MSLSRAAIVDQLKEIVGADRVITDETVLKKNSIDRFRKFPDIHGIYTLPIPAAVVKLGSTEQVSRVLNFMNAHKINGVPRTGASATEGGLETVVENSVVLDGSAMNQIINIDIENMQATAQCGVPLEVLENALREKGYTTGHSPQSKPLAQMGGLVATRSIGQFSTLYGAIEDMVVGLEAVLADGTVTRIKNVPRRAAGPDIRHIIIGNEGALCYITEVTVKIFKFTPENNLFYGYILEDMKTGFNILREIMVEGYRPSIARLYDAEDGTQHFTHFADGKCVLIFMAEGNPRITPAMQLTPFMAGMIGGSALLGLFLGSLVLGWISDHIGRQKIFTFSFLLITLASFLQFFATTPEHLIGLRILIGIGLGGDYSVGHTLLAEFSPRRHRGILLGAFSVVWTVGYVLASIAGHHFISENPEAWRWLLASAALPALLITLLRWGTPESPRWLLRQGRFAEAHAIVHRYFGPHVLLGDEVVTATHKHIKTLFSSRYWRRTAFNSVFFVCLVIPWFVIYTWLPTIAQTIGLEDALTASLMLNALLIVGALLGLVLTHLLAHRKFLLGSFLLLAATLVVMACLPSGSSLTLLLFVLFSTTISAVSNLVGILPAESFPTDIRSLGVGFATAMSRLGAAVSTGLLPWVLAQWGMQVTLLLLATVLLVGFVVTWLWAPETKALPLVAAGNVGGANEHSVSV